MSRNSRNPISWVPTVYFAMGLPFVVLNMVSVLMLKAWASMMRRLLCGHH